MEKYIYQLPKIAYVYFYIMIISRPTVGLMKKKVMDMRNLPHGVSTLKYQKIWAFTPVAVKYPKILGKPVSACQSNTQEKIQNAPRKRIQTQSLAQFQYSKLP